MYPPLTEERRLDLVKKAKVITEDTKIGIRNARRQGNDEAKLEKMACRKMRQKLMDEIQNSLIIFSKIDNLFETKKRYSNCLKSILNILL